MKFTSNGLEIFYTDSGTPQKSKQTEAIIFVHGFPHTHHYWEKQIQGLSKDFRVVTFDLREHGQSQIGDGNILIEFFVDDLIALFDHLELNKVALCGLSMGGYIALRAIERHPDRFSSLILCNTSADADDNAAKLKRAKSIQMIREKGFEAFVDNYMDGVLMPETLQETPELLQQFREIILENKPSTVKSTFIALSARMDMNQSLAQISVPTLVIVGEKDQVTPLDKAKKIQQAIVGSRLEVIAGVGHLSSFEAPEEFNDLIKNFLEN